VTVAAPFGSGVGTEGIWSDFTVRHDVDNNPLAADVAAAATVASAVASQYFARIYRQTAGFMRQTYTGALPFATGSLVDGVRWRQDTRDAGRGWVTEITRGPEPAWPELVVRPLP
jgi:hypothetical protein